MYICKAFYIRWTKLEHVADLSCSKCIYCFHKKPHSCRMFVLVQIIAEKWQRNYNKASCTFPMYADIQISHQQHKKKQTKQTNEKKNIIWITSYSKHIHSFILFFSHKHINKYTNTTQIEATEMFNFRCIHMCYMNT